MNMNEKLKRAMQHDISRCRAQTEANGSSALLSELVSKYKVIDKDILDHIGFIPTIEIDGEEIDCTPDLKNLAATLEMMLLLDDDETPTTPLREQVNDFIARGEEIKAKESKTTTMGYLGISGPEYRSWINEINIFSQRHLSNRHPLYSEISYACTHQNLPSTFKNLMGYLQTLLNDNEFWSTDYSNSINRTDQGVAETTHMKDKVFIVHGHDKEAIAETALTLERAGFEAIILHEQPDIGNTIIEKIEKHTDVAYAVILYTPCDLGRAKEELEDKYRARQNVVFEHGYLMGKLGRDHVAALVKGNIETPGDLGGIVYIPMDPDGFWKVKLAKSMNAVNLNFDLNSIK